LKLLFTYLTAFKGHGGIEKFNKALLKALEFSQLKNDFSAVSAYDHKHDSNYLSAKSFIGYSGNKLKYTLGILRNTMSSDVLVVGHINLAPVAVIAKLLRPKLKVVLVAHGIDVWYELPGIKYRLLKIADLVLSVSSFTKDKLIVKHAIDTNKIKLFPNTLDPFFQFPSTFEKPAYLQERYKLSGHEKILLSICRLSSQEGYKGYDTVINALPQVLDQDTSVKYIIVGKYDQQEYNRIISLARKLGVENNVLLTGYVPDEELTDHYLLGDLFVMPSREEGFGIVYIEAMACGLPVIAGNADGSVDALDHGRLGTLVDPTNTEQIATVITKVLSGEMTVERKKDLQLRVINKFGFESFKARLNTIIEEISKNVRH
jgi:phosphatidyl-myo-inositol dimannoside synthase